MLAIGIVGNGNCLCRTGPEGGERCASYMADDDTIWMGEMARRGGKKKGGRGEEKSGERRRRRRAQEAGDIMQSRPCFECMQGTGIVISQRLRLKRGFMGED